MPFGCHIMVILEPWDLPSNPSSEIHKRQGTHLDHLLMTYRPDLALPEQSRHDGVDRMRVDASSGVPQVVGFVEQRCTGGLFERFVDRVSELFVSVREAEDEDVLRSHSFLLDACRGLFDLSVLVHSFESLGTHGSPEGAI